MKVQGRSSVSTEFFFAASEMVGDEDKLRNFVKSYKISPSLQFWCKKNRWTDSADNATKYTRSDIDDLLDTEEIEKEFQKMWKRKKKGPILVGVEQRENKFLSLGDFFGKENDLKEDKGDGTKGNKDPSGKVNGGKPNGYSGGLFKGVKIAGVVIIVGMVALFIYQGSKRIKKKSTKKKA